MDKIAIISDIHGNLEALKAVINDIRARGIKRIFCLGDIIGRGIHNSECLELIKESCEVILIGNNEAPYCNEIVQVNDQEKYEKRIKATEASLTNEAKEVLKSLTFSYEFYMSGSLIRLFHANPYNTWEAFYHVDKIRTKINLFNPSEKTMSSKKCDIAIYGHAHSQFMEKYFNRTLINCGGVGISHEIFREAEENDNDRETTNAFYLIIEGLYNHENSKEALSFNFIRVPYDINKEIEPLLDNPEYAEYIKELKTGCYSANEIIKKIYLGRGIDLDDC